MPIDAGYASIPLQIQSPNPTTMISSFLDLGKKKIELDKSRETFDADVARTKALSRQAETEAGVSAGTAASRVSSAQSAAGTAAAQMSGAELENMRAHVSNAVQQMETLRQDPQLTREKVIGSIITSALNSKAPTAAIAQALQGLPDGDDPQALHGFITKALVRAQSAATHLGVTNPSPQFLSNGQQTVPVATGNPALTGVAPGTPQGVPTQQQLPPTTPTMIAGQPGYLGPQAAPPAPNAPPIASGPRLGQAEAVSGQVTPLVKHYESVVADATAAPTRIGILQEIKGLAPAAVTGDATTLKNIVSKLAGYVGMDSATIAQTATDVLAKEAALLASKGGNTDMARLLNEAATPNGKMTKEAIYKTADQLIGLEKRAQAAQPYFAGTPADSALYAQKKALWDKNADPRAFEYAGKTPAEQSRMKADMQKAGTWDALRQKMVQLHAMGVEP